MEYRGIFDTHAHYDDAQFDASRAAVIETQRACGIAGVVNCASDEKSAAACVALAQTYGFFYAGVGVHPEEAGKLEAGWLERIAALARREKKVVAIAEIGLDYHWPDPPREVQKPVFEAQLALANELSLPVEIHDRDAHGDVFELCDKYRPRGCWHRYSGSPEMAKEIVRRGMLLGIGGAVTYRNSKKEIATVAAIPLESLLLETDCPYQAPQPFRGELCTSDMLWTVAERIAEIKGVTPQQVVDVTRGNALRLFGLPPL
ncbi:MAG: TatD family hydrolase [Oscillospiraceae bacterium]|nr:TatD family hydrolase [Oscillospiraceae bacterium]